MSSVGMHQVVLAPRENIAEVDLPEPGIVRHVEIGVEQSTIAGADGRIGARERVVLFVEVDPDAPRRRRTFLLLPPTVVFAPKDGFRALWRGIGVSPSSGAVVCVFELVHLAELAATRPSLVAK